MDHTNGGLEIVGIVDEEILSTTDLLDNGADSYEEEIILFQTSNIDGQSDGDDLLPNTTADMLSSTDGENDSQEMKETHRDFTI